MSSDQLLREMRRTVSQLEALTEIGKRLTHNLELGDVLSAIMDYVGQVLSTTNWSLLLVHEDVLRFEVAVGEGASHLRGKTLKLGEGIAGWVAEHQQPVFVPDVSKDSRFSSKFDTDNAFETSGVLAAPLTCRGKLLGVMELVTAAGQPAFDAQDLQILSTFADFAAIAIDNAKNYERVQELTVSDEVTRLNNARYLHRILPLELARAQRYAQPVSVIFFDLDRFKMVNDTHGHQAGSRLLYEVGEIVREQLRRIDIGIRFGGDEFVLILPETDVKGARVVAERLRARFEHTSFLAERGLAVKQTASFGSATYPMDGDNEEMLLKAADKAMYRVKESSRNGVKAASD